MVLVYVPAWVFAGMVSIHKVPSTVAPMPDVGAASATDAGVQVVPELVFPHSATVTGVVTEFFGSVQVDPAAHTPFGGGSRLHGNVIVGVTGV